MLKIETKSLKKGLRIKLIGELTIYSAMDCLEALKQCLQQQKSIIIDLSAISEIDTTGAQLLMSFNQSLKNQNLKFELEKQSIATEQFFSLFNLDRYLCSGDVQ